MWIELIGDAVGIQQQQIAGLGIEDHFFVFAVVEQAGRNTFHARLEDLAVAANHGRLGAGVGHDEAAVRALPNSTSSVT